MSNNEKLVFIYIAIFIIIFATITIRDINKPEEVMTVEEREMLARLVYLEAGTCSSECQKAIASVVLNMRDAGYWGNTIEEVINYPNAFSPAYMIPDCIPNHSSYEAVDYVIQQGSTLPSYVRYFRADKDHEWIGYENYTVIDNVYFGYFTNGSY